ncbi:MAG: cytidine deaminase [Holophagaceae bacterium]|nr:cytidine deaminase [Holophagaceae bacterium]
MPFETAQAPEWTPLLKAAWEARGRAHAPYSGFQVGAALLRRGGSVVAGCNVENASYPMCTCAERTAVCAAVAAGMKEGELEAIAVVTGAEVLTPPCGACRQVLVEFADDLPILLDNGRQRVLRHLKDLLPDAFTGRNFTPPGQDSSHRQL